MNVGEQELRLWRAVPARVAAKRCGSVVMLGLCVLATGAAAAPSDVFASAWAPGAKSSIRLIAAGGAAGSPYRAGIEIRLAPGAITYWRQPGDSGTPPVLDSKGSENVADVRLAFPAPAKLDEAGDVAFGYQDDVVLPLTVMTVDPGRSSILRIRLDYAVCEKICIPAHGEAALPLEQGTEPGPYAAVLAQAHARVPSRQPPGASGPLVLTGFSAVTATPASFLVSGRAPPGVDRVDLFPEAPEGWYLEAGAVALKPDGTFTVPVTASDMPKGGQLTATPFTFTIVAGDHAIEVSTRLDAHPPAP